ncbi:MAG: 2-enoyl thioester reductase domain-containing protein, partial [Kiloniellales bacterium]|nr:2-enoyl thioester reductase domain-containing protein [Kiloniellales bacterium]
MKIAQLTAFGDPARVVECVEAEDPGAPGPGQVLVEMLACPINPAEILIIGGKYASKPPLPARLGIEGAGRVAAVGDGVEGLAPGDLVMSLGRANWAERLVLEAGEVVKAPAGTDAAQLAMLKVNPATAHLMLSGIVPLSPGDWVIQNAANSGVGVNLIRLARARDLRTVNVVRREELIAPLEAIGADAVLVDGPDLAERAAAATGGAAIRLALDAVAGAATERLADCLAEGGTVVNYGFLSGEACRLRADQTVFKGITLTGFWLAKALH